VSGTTAYQKGMPVEILQSGQWVPVPDATEQHVESNRYLVTITGLPIWVRLNALDGAPLRVAGHETFNVWGTRKTNDTLVLDVLVR
jgi:hypothetical protein